MKSTLVIISLLFALLSPCIAQNTEDLTGTWLLCDQNGNVPETDNKEYKIISENTFTVLNVLDSKKVFMGIFRGIYEQTKTEYKEIIQYALPASVSNVGKEHTFTYQVKDGYWIVKGKNNPYNQIWKKVTNFPEQETGAMTRESRNSPIL